MSDLSRSDDASAAPFLFLEKDISAENVGAPHFTGVSTGERLIRDRPDVYQAIVYLLGQGTGIREIKRITGVHHRTIEAVMVREGQTIDTARKELGARALRVAAMGVERLEEIIADGNIKPGELSMAVGILTDKAQLLTGGVTSRVEKVEQSQVAAGLERMLDDLPVIDGEWEDTSETNLGGENQQPIAALDEPDPNALVQEIAQVPVKSSVPSSDEQSVVLEDSDSVDAISATAYATELAPKSPSKQPPRPSQFKTKASPSKGSKEGGRGSAAKPRPRKRD